eukprot:COSAG04_NODE_22267_length_358_cov_0.482625_2_plen_20_part_01
MSVCGRGLGFEGYLAGGAPT